MIVQFSKRGHILKQKICFRLAGWYSDIHPEIRAYDRIFCIGATKKEVIRTSRQRELGFLAEKSYQPSAAYTNADAGGGADATQFRVEATYDIADNYSAFAS